MGWTGKIPVLFGLFCRTRTSQRNSVSEYHGSCIRFSMHTGKDCAPEAVCQVSANMCSPDLLNICLQDFIHRSIRFQRPDPFIQAGQKFFLVGMKPYAKQGFRDERIRDGKIFGIQV